MLSKILSYLFILPIIIYKKAISPFLLPSCRYYPTCSTYSVEALKKHGPIVGLFLSVRRMFFCSPWGGSGKDKVPETFYWSKKKGIEKNDLTYSNHFNFKSYINYLKRDKL